MPGDGDDDRWFLFYAMVVVRDDTQDGSWDGSDDKIGRHGGGGEW